MTPQPFDPATQGELNSSPMTPQEGKAVLKGNADRRAAWERRRAIVSHPAFHAGQNDPSHDPIWGELHRGRPEPIEYGRDFLQDLVTRAKEAATEVVDAYKDMAVEAWRGWGEIAEGVKGAIYETVRRNGQNEIESIRAQMALAPDTLNRVQNAASGVPAAINNLSPHIFGPGKPITRGSPLPDEIPTRPEKPIINTDGGRPFLAYWEFEGPEIENFPALLERAASGLDDFAPSAANAGRSSQDFNDEAVGLTGTITGVNEVIAATPGHIADVNASFAETSRERLPEMIGKMGTLKDQTLATVGALDLLAAVPRMPSGSGWSSARASGRGAARMETDPLAHDPRYNPGEGESWGHYYQVALNLAKNGRTERERKLGRERAVRAAQILGIPVPTFAGGTSFAPGGMALVGEMGPELVNLPRGSQVIPNPRLGSEVTVNVTVEGSVVAERDLAQRIRQELIRTSRRTVDLGFVT